MSPKKQLVTNPNIFEVLPHTYGTSTIFVNAFPYGNKWDVHWYLSLITTERTCNISLDANDVSNKLHAKIRGERHNLVLHNLVVESNIPYDTSLRGSLNILLKNTPKKRICFLLSVHESPVPSILEKKRGSQDSGCPQLVAEGKKQHRIMFGTESSLSFIGNKTTMGILELYHLATLKAKYTCWWLNQPIWKICSSKWESSPNRGENKKCLKPPPS